MKPNCIEQHNSAVSRKGLLLLLLSSYLGELLNPWPQTSKPALTMSQAAKTFSLVLITPDFKICGHLTEEFWELQSTDLKAIRVEKLCFRSRCSTLGESQYKQIGIFKTDQSVISSHFTPEFLTWHSSHNI